MRFWGLNHLDICVIDYENSLKFYDNMFGWLGYTSWSAHLPAMKVFTMGPFPTAPLGFTLQVRNFKNL